MLNRVRNKFRTLGWVDALWFIIASLLRLASFGSVRLIKYYFVAQPVRLRAPGTAQAHGKTRLSVVQGVNDIIRQAPRPEATLLQRFEQRARCVLAERDGQLAGFIWLCPNRYSEDEVRGVYCWTPVQIAVWDFDVFVAPPFRMGRLFSQLWAYSHALLQPEGVRWTLSRIDAFNAGSLAAHRRLGAVVLARGCFLRFGRFQIALTSMAPHWHLSARDANAPQFCFDLSKLGPSLARQ
jgi:hypothetical protein